jgi:hypothetical protein
VEAGAPRGSHRGSAERLRAPALLLLLVPRLRAALWLLAAALRARSLVGHCRISSGRCRPQTLQRRGSGSQHFLRRVPRRRSPPATVPVRCATYRGEWARDCPGPLATFSVSWMYRRTGEPLLPPSSPIFQPATTFGEPTWRSRRSVTAPTRLLRRYVHMAEKLLPILRDHEAGQLRRVAARVGRPQAEQLGEGLRSAAFAAATEIALRTRTTRSIPNRCPAGLAKAVLGVPRAGRRRKSTLDRGWRCLVLASW